MAAYPHCRWDAMEVLNRQNLFKPIGSEPV